MRKVAEQGPPLTALRVDETRPITRTTISGRVIADRATIHVPDYQLADMAREYPDVRRDSGIRTTIGIPLLREGAAIGSFTAYRTESRPFSAEQIALAQTFADQAVIAIENTRLFQELEDRNRALAESLEQQTATGEILGVIASSPTELRPVLEAIAENASRLCAGDHGSLYRLEAVVMHQVADAERPSRTAPRVPRDRAHRPGRPPSGRAILDRNDRPTWTMSTSSPDIAEEFPECARDTSGCRSDRLAMPLVRERVRPSASCSRVPDRRSPALHRHGRSRLLQTFADQAVIAIENVRLFTELEARNRELTEALEQQTATAEILRVISTSPTNLEPVLDAVVKSAARFCGAPDASVFRLDGEALRAVAHHGPVSQPTGFLVPVVRGSVAGRSLLERQAVGVTDLQVETEEFPEGSALARQTGHRATLGVPLLREGVPIGVILLRRAEAVPFTDKQIALLQTFADQAVIAIENVRLFQELEARNHELTESLEQQTATAEILPVILSSPTDVQPVFDAIVAERRARCARPSAARSSGSTGALIHLVAQHGVTPEAIRRQSA